MIKGSSLNEFSHLSNEKVSHVVKVIHAAMLSKYKNIPGVFALIVEEGDFRLAFSKEVFNYSMGFKSFLRNHPFEIWFKWFRNTT